MGLTPKRVTVLREVVELSRAPMIVGVGDGWIVPYHVIYFRGSGRADHAPSWAYEAGMSTDAAARHLRRLAQDGLLDRKERRGLAVEYRVNDAGREALAEWDRSHV